VNNLLRISVSAESALDPPIAVVQNWLAEIRLHSQKVFFDLTQGLPNFEPSKFLLEEVARQVLDHKTSEYTEILGLRELRRAYVKDLNEFYNANCRFEQIIITSGANHGFAMASLAIADEGDEALISEPHFFNHRMWLEIQGVKVKTFQCHPSVGAMLPDLEQIRGAITEKTRMIVLSNPNNPTGTKIHDQLLNDILDLAYQNGIFLILDETYRDFINSTRDIHTLFSNERSRDSLVHLYSFSKAFSIPGYRVGAMCVPPLLVRSITKIADSLTICPPNISQRAAIYALTNLKPWLENKTQEAAEMLDQFHRNFVEFEPNFELVSSGAFYVYLRHPFVSIGSIDVAKKLLENAGIAVLPGEFFGTSQRRFLRLSLSNLRHEDVPIVVEKIHTAFQSIKNT
jgi:aspartate/methionine/tyrosine aminotransferase